MILLFIVSAREESLEQEAHRYKLLIIQIYRKRIKMNHISHRSETSSFHKEANSNNFYASSSPNHTIVTQLYGNKKKHNRRTTTHPSLGNNNKE